MNRHSRSVGWNAWTLLGVAGLVLQGAAAGYATTNLEAPLTAPIHINIGILPLDHSTITRFPTKEELQADAKKQLLAWLDKQDAATLDSVQSVLGSLPGKVGEKHGARVSRTLVAEMALTAWDIQKGLSDLGRRIREVEMEEKTVRALTKTGCAIGSSGCGALFDQLDIAQARLELLNQELAADKAAIKALELTLLDAGRAEAGFLGDITVPLKKDVDYTTQAGDGPVLKIVLQ